MNFQEYKTYFESILNKGETEQEYPYDNPDYLDYTKLNWSRMNRWLKTGKLSGTLLDVVQQIKSPQHWVIITEPWCGDAAHSVPFIKITARQNPNITVSYQLRDSEPFLINQYLTNGSRSIPKLIIRDEEQNDLGTWGPRPKDCQTIYGKLVNENADFETVKTEIQKWYNANKGEGIQNELRQLIKQTILLKTEETP